MSMIFDLGASAAPRGTSRESTPRHRSVQEKAELFALISRCQRGDLGAQSALIRLYQARVAGLVRPIVRNNETVKDVVQAVALKLVRRLPDLRDPATFESWLFTMARNTAVDEIRRARCRPVSMPNDSMVAEINDPAPEDRSGELLEAVQLATRNWDPLNRRILERIASGMSYRRVAEREGLTVGAVKLRVHRLRRILRERIGHFLDGAEGSPRRVSAVFL